MTKARLQVGLATSEPEMFSGIGPFGSRRLWHGLGPPDDGGHGVACFTAAGRTPTMAAVPDTHLVTKADIREVRDGKQLF